MENVPPIYSFTSALNIFGHHHLSSVYSFSLLLNVPASGQFFHLSSFTVKPYLSKIPVSHPTHLIKTSITFHCSQDHVSRWIIAFKMKITLQHAGLRGLCLQSHAVFVTASTSECSYMDGIAKRFVKQPSQSYIGSRK